MATTFIFQRRTPRQVRFIPAKAVRSNGKGGYYHLPLLRSDETLAHTQAMAALSKCMRGLPLGDDLLKRAFETAQQVHPYLVEGVTFSPRQASGRPPMLIVKGDA